MSALTVSELSARLGVPPRQVRELMRQDEARGLVAIDPRGRWSLTPAAEREFGSTLRGLTRPAGRSTRRGLRAAEAGGDRRAPMSRARRALEASYPRASRA
jgi:DNA-binding transcriptional ArsR family regulator